MSGDAYGGDVPSTPSMRYGTIVADPPWHEALPHIDYTFEWNAGEMVAG